MSDRRPDEASNCLPTDMTEVPAWLRARCGEHASVYDIAVSGRPETWLAIAEVLSCALLAAATGSTWAKIAQEDPPLKWLLNTLRSIARENKDPLIESPADHICWIAASLIEEAALSRAQSTGAGVKQLRFEDGYPVGYSNGLLRAATLIEAQDGMQGWKRRLATILRSEASSATLATPAGDDVKRLACHDCQRPYGDEHGFPDLVVAHDVWKKISPTGDEGGLLCPSCMCRRAADADLENITAEFRSGPFAIPAKRTLEVRSAKVGLFGEALFQAVIRWEELKPTRCARLIGTFKSYAEAEHEGNAALAATPASLECIENVPCRFGCEAATGIYYIPKGCACWNDPVQALCEQHAIKAQSEGSITLIARLHMAVEVMDEPTTTS